MLEPKMAIPLFYYAILSGNTVSAKTFIENGADVNVANKYGWTLLYYAIWGRNIKLVIFMIKQIKL